ncbi:MAG: aminoglycoside/choline kinase family phosphotransferase [Alphaproteobacteria bacterium]|jgi:aminoglycoside/choline kinase family phosphotransferase
MQDASPENSERKALFEQFLKQNGYKLSDLVALKGDASRRRFYRHTHNKKSVIIIDANPDTGEEPNAYAAVTLLLEKHHFSVPSIHASNTQNGFFIVEDFGDTLYATAINNATADQNVLYKNALDLLVSLQAIHIDPVLSYGDGTYKLQDYDINRLISEIKIFTDWYFPEITKRPTPSAAKNELNTIFRGLLLPVIHESSCLVLRDYHGENLMVLEDRTALQSVGLLDYQDAVIGNRAYDVVSLLQDARRDIAPEFEKSMLDYYLSTVNLDNPNDFMRDYYILGAQRSLKILGIFTRLWIRDNKEHYLPHMQRVWQYLERDLAQPQLKPLKDWFDRWLPASLRFEIKVA